MRGSRRAAGSCCAALIGRGVRVALITGRPLEMCACRWPDLDGAAYAANHGLELWVDGTSVIAELAAAITPRLVDQVNRQAQELAREGVTIEHKGPVLAFHYRQARTKQRLAVARIVEVIGSAPAARRFSADAKGRKVIELRPPMSPPTRERRPLN